MCHVGKVVPHNTCQVCGGCGGGEDLDPFRLSWVSPSITGCRVTRSSVPPTLSKGR